MRMYLYDYMPDWQITNDKAAHIWIDRCPKICQLPFRVCQLYSANPFKIRRLSIVYTQ